MPSVKEVAQVPQAITPAVELTRGFPAEDDISIGDTDRALAARFQAVGMLGPVVDYIVEHDRQREFPDLGILGTVFRIGKPGPGHVLNLAPMGANDDVLLGCTPIPVGPSRIGGPLKEGEVVDLCSTGVAATVGTSSVAYAVLNRHEVSAAGFGFMKYTGRVATFSNVPDNEQLQAFVASVVPDTPEFPMARVDMSALPVGELRI
jgi:hypothetical protein